MTLYSVAEPGLPKAENAGPDQDLARRHWPLLMLDDNEPVLPLVFGYTVARATTPSPSSKFVLTPPPGGTVIEYAIWYDWDIEHLYDLEHVWVHVDKEGAVCRVEASMHGLRVSMDDGSGLPGMKGERPVLYVEPGKHALWCVERAMAMMAGAMIRQKCGPDAGSEGVHTGNGFFQSGAYTVSAADHRLARLAMTRAGFTPSFSFSRSSDAHRPSLVPWSDLERWIPVRMKALIAGLRENVPHIEALFFDCGDTLIDEGSEIRQPGSDVVVKGDFIPGARAAFETLATRGYRLALVADGLHESFENLLRPQGLWDRFEAHVISEDIGDEKPSPKMFLSAMAALDLAEKDRNRIVMIGNNLERDIRGANALGLISLFVAWSDRRSHHPADALETPDYRVDRLEDLVSLVETIELALAPNEVGHD